jgi:hypothetical protein
MTPERWQQIKQVCQLALEHEPGERAAFLTRAFAADASLRAEVERLLQNASSVEDVPQSPIWHQLVPPVSSPRIDSRDLRTPSVPKQLGRYNIIGVLGQGGMGTVYEAEQDSPRRRVALKVIKPGLSNPEILKRFERESQALGRLQHPGIAQIYEAGTADTGFGSRPYFAMEFIQGKPLKDYITARALEIPERLEVVAKVCDAVQHAHDRGIIHRDLKPGNILVDRMGQPKVLDFGVARVVEGPAPETLYTTAGELVGTLAYMSPEQVRADAASVDGRSDVYAIGVMLYELLAGRLPYNVSGLPHEAVHTILEEDPRPLSTISRRFKGDIATIVAKALEKDAARRYASTAALAADLRRYLDNEPITARRPSTIYQLQKFVRRHIPLVAGVVAVFVALMGGTIVSAWQALRARTAERGALEAENRAKTERDEAVRERNRSLAAEELAQQERNRAIAAQQLAQEERGRAVAAGQRASNEAAISRAVRDFLQSDLLAQSSAQQQASPNSKPDPDLKVRTALDRAAARVPERFHGQPLVEAAVRQTIGAAYLDLGLYGQAHEQFKHALQLRRDTVGPQHELSLDAQKSLAGALMLEGKYPEAEALYLQAIQGLQRRRGENDLSVLEARAELAEVYLDEGRYVPAETLLIATLETQRRVLGPERAATLSSLLELGRAQIAQGKYADAETSLRTLLDGQQRTKGAEHPDTLTAETDLAQVLMREFKYDEAETRYKLALDAERRVLGPDHPYTLGTANGLALLYKTEGMYARAEPLYVDILSARERLVGSDHPDTLIAMNNLGALYVAEHRYSEAEPLLMRTLADRKRVLGPEHPNTLNTMVNLAQVYLGEGRVADALPLYSEVVSIRLRILGPEHPDTLFMMANLGVVYGAEGHFSDAERLLTHVRDVRRRLLGDRHPSTAQVTDNLGQLYLRRGEIARAQALFAEALEDRRRALGPDNVDTLRSQSNLAEAYREAGEIERGAALLAETLLRARAMLTRDNDVTLGTIERLAEAYRRQGRLADAQTLLVQALESRRRVLGPLHPDTIEDVVKLGQVFLDQRQDERAEETLRQAVSADNKLIKPWILYEAKSALGAVLTAQRRFGEAEAQALAAYEGLVGLGETIPAESKHTITQTVDRLDELYRAWGNQERAAAWASRLRRTP